MWEIYNRLIEEIPSEILVTEVFLGEAWVYVNALTPSGIALTGVAMNSSGGQIRSEITGDLENLSLRDVAAYSKSWNFTDASIGMAAINAYYNSIETMQAFGIHSKGNDNRGAFEVFTESITGKRVAVVGHFPKVETLAEICTLTVLERNPILNDLPDTACEFVLPEQDFIFITGVTMINKTLPRLLQLGKNSKIIMVGPTVTLSPIFFEYGVDCLSGSRITDGTLLNKIIKEGGCTNIFRNGAQMIQIEKD